MAILTDRAVVLMRDPALGPVAGTDTDRDGLADAWELDWGTDPRVPDARMDYDGDGMSNEDERAAGTDPRDPGSRLALEAAAGGLLRFEAKSGRRYILEKADRLGADWVSVGDTIVGSGSVVERTVGLGGGGTHFMRVRVVP